MRTLLTATLLLLILITGCGQTGEETPDLATLELRLESIRLDMNIPGMTATIARAGEVTWSEGFGYASIQDSITASDSTVYLLASPTKTLAATVIMQLVQQGLVDIDQPLSVFGIDLSEGRAGGLRLQSEDSITVRHLLTHTAEGIPGSHFRYRGYLFGLLGKIMEHATEKTFQQLVMENVIGPLNLQSTVPNIRHRDFMNFGGADTTTITANLAGFYYYDQTGTATPTDHEAFFGTSAGMMTTAGDLAVFGSALLSDRILGAEYREQMFAPAISTAGDTLPYGLGWFVGSYGQYKICWHTGKWGTNSSLIMVIPELDLSFAILANSNRLTGPFATAEGNPFATPSAIAFLECCVSGEDGMSVIDFDRPTSEIAAAVDVIEDARQREFIRSDLIGKGLLHHFGGRPDSALRCFKHYQSIFARPLPDGLTSIEPIAVIDSVTNNSDLSTPFELSFDGRVRVVAVGEGRSEMWDYGWIVDQKSGDTVWQMKLPKSSYAGGDRSNRIVDTVMSLPAGAYDLHYHSDGSHSFQHWLSSPPEFALYGIAVYSAQGSE